MRKNYQKCEKISYNNDYFLIISNILFLNNLQFHKVDMYIIYSMHIFYTVEKKHIYKIINTLLND